MSEHPFGTEIRADDVVDALAFFDGWEERYGYIIDLGRQLPSLPEECKREEFLVRGCQSQVWLLPSLVDGRVDLRIDSDALIVRGLIALVLAAYQGLTPQALLDVDIEGYFARLDLLSHLSPTRGNGLRAMVARIREFARSALAG
jgi:cysteine desulfuration protein SufE